MKKYILISPPIWPPFSPYLAIPSLFGQLKKEGFDAEAIDLNIEFYNDILKKDYLEKIVKGLKKIQSRVSKESKNYDYNHNEIDTLPIQVQEIILKNNEIETYLNKKSELLKIVPGKVEQALSNLKTKESFYDPKTFITSSKTVLAALEIASLPYAPAKISLHEYINPLFKRNYENLKYNIFSSSTNIFAEYFKKWLPIIKNKKPDYIGISITSIQQLIPGLTLSSLLKKHTNAHINLGGNHLSRIIDSISNHLEFFDLFADSIAVDEGEKTIIELAKYIDNRIKIEQVPNLVYKKGNKIIKNEKSVPLELDEIATPCYEGFDFSKYIIPEVILPIQTTAGCYWRKCSFCDMSYGKKYNVKNTEKLINELKEYKLKYGINNFDIVDEAIHPSHLEKMAEAIIDSNLDIKYFAYKRTEKTITKELLEKAKKSGLTLILWGIESGSERILRLMNKGVETKDRFRILKTAKEQGIWNHAFAIFNFPSESFEEAEETIKVLKQNKSIIDSLTTDNFQLGKHSKIRKNPEFYGITKISEENVEFSTMLIHESQEKTKEETEMTAGLINKLNSKINSSDIWKNCNSFQHLFLYVSKYGTDWVKNYKVDNKN